MKRFNEIIVLAGGRGCGKTTYVKGNKAERFPAKLFSQYAKHPTIKKKLIVDTFDSPVWREFPEMPKYKNSNAYDPWYFLNWKKGTYRMFDGRTDRINMLISKYLYNALVVYEDATKTVGTRLTKDMRYFLLDSKQQNLDIVLIFHSISAIPLELGRMPFDRLILFKTGEKWDKCKDRITDPQGKVEKAFFKLNKSNNRFDNRVVDLRI